MLNSNREVSLENQKIQRFKGELCLGFQTTVSDRLQYRSVNTAIESIYINFAFYPDNLRFKKEEWVNYLAIIIYLNLLQENY